MSKFIVRTEEGAYLRRHEEVGYTLNVHRSKATRFPTRAAAEAVAQGWDRVEVEEIDG